MPNELSHFLVERFCADMCRRLGTPSTRFQNNQFNPNPSRKGYLTIYGNYQLTLKDAEYGICIEIHHEDAETLDKFASGLEQIFEPKGVIKSISSNKSFAPEVVVEVTLASQVPNEELANEFTERVMRPLLKKAFYNITT